MEAKTVTVRHVSQNGHRQENEMVQRAKAEDRKLCPEACGRGKYGFENGEFDDDVSENRDRAEGCSDARRVSCEVCQENTE